MQVVTHQQRFVRALPRARSRGRAAPVGDTITLRADVTDSAVYRVPSQIYILCEDVRTR